MLVTGLSGGGKASVLRALEDLGYEAVDNPPLPMLEDMVSAQRAQAGDRRGCAHPRLRCRRWCWRRWTGCAPTRRCGPSWSTPGRTKPRCCAATPRRGGAIRWRRRAGWPTASRAKELLTAPLREGADLVIDTSDLPLASLRRLIERHFGAGSDAEESRLVVSLISFAYRPACRGKQTWYSMHAFCEIPTTIPYCGHGRGWMPRSAPIIEADPDFATFFARWLD